MVHTVSISGTEVSHLANLANLELSPSQKNALTISLGETLNFVKKVQQLQSNLPPATRVTGRSNVTRTDAIEPSRVFSQDQALANSPHVYHGYFVVDAILKS